MSERERLVALIDELAVIASRTIAHHRLRGHHVEVAQAMEAHHHATTALRALAGLTGTGGRS